MASIARFWSVALESPPKLRHMAIATHGQYPCEIYRNLSYWCIHAYHYAARLRLGDQWFDLKPGVVSLVPPNIEMEYQYTGASTHTFAHFYLPAGASFLKRHGKPIVTTLGIQRFRRFDGELREAASWFATEPARAQARVWDLLWEVVALEPREASEPGDPRIDRALKQIELQLDSRISVEAIATELEISPAQLVRLFHKHVGSTPLAYVIRRRVERAEHLLRHTTQPIKSIARQIGMSDLQQLNKLLRKTLGKSPREIRHRQ